MASLPFPRLKCQGSLGIHRNKTQYGEPDNLTENIIFG